MKRDIFSREDTHGDRFVISTVRRLIRDRGIAGELINRIAGRMRGTKDEKRIGSFAGFTLTAVDTFMKGPEILIKGALRCKY